MNIGNLEEYEYDGEIHMSGHIKTLGHDLKVRLVPTGEEVTDRFPAYTVLTKGSGTTETQIGAAWRKKLNNPTSQVKDFLSITLDDPTFPTPLNIAAFLQGDGKWTVTWRRRQAAA